MTSVTQDYNLHVLNPKLSGEWNPTKNGSLTPRDVAPNSHKKAWWICSKGHEWQALISNRNRGRGCPYCSGRKATKENNLQNINPILAKEWHPTKNGAFTPRDVTPKSNKKAWWICSKRHEWFAIINNRAKGHGCPYCTHQKVRDDNCLMAVNPKLSKEWHPTKNGALMPRDVFPGSNKKAWWRCNRGHEWRAVINSRNMGKGCPNCRGKSTSEIEIRIFSELKYLIKNVKHREKIFGVECDIYIPFLNFGIEVDGYYFHKDKLLKDQQKTYFLKKKKINILRLREKGLERISRNDIFFDQKYKIDLMQNIVDQILRDYDLHPEMKRRLQRYKKRKKFANDEYYRRIIDRLPSPPREESLDACDSSLAKEWHPTKNGTLTPRDITPNSGLKVWWICLKGH